MSCGTCPESGQATAQTAALSGGQVLGGWAIDVKQWFAERRQACREPVIRASLDQSEEAQAARALLQAARKLVTAADEAVLYFRAQFQPALLCRYGSELRLWRWADQPAHRFHNEADGQGLEGHTEQFFTPAGAADRLAKLKEQALADKTAFCLICGGALAAGHCRYCDQQGANLARSLPPTVFLGAPEALSDVDRVPKGEEACG